MNAIRASVMILFAFATSVIAQEPAFSAGLTASCLKEAVGQSERIACIGVASSACLSPPEIGGSYAETYCYSREVDYWDQRLNETYQRQQQSYRSDNPALANALRDLQRAWIVYRDARCQAVLEDWGEGTGRTPAFAQCLMQTTAEQVMFLEGGL